jgi:hypothetical protein
MVVTGKDNPDEASSQPAASRSVLEALGGRVGSRSPCR